MPDDEQIHRLRVRFHGNVEGVWYRATARDAARRVSEEASPVTGWVRNEPDGTVLMEAQGTPEAIAELLQRIEAERPGYATRIDREPIPTVEDEDGFEIRR